MAVIVVSTKTKNTFLSQKCGNGIISFFSENLQNNNSSVDIRNSESGLLFCVYVIHQNPHKPNMTYKFILLERRLSSFTAAPQIFVSQTVLQL